MTGVVRIVHHPWLRIGIAALAFIITGFAVALLIAQHRAGGRDRIIGQLACEVEQLGGRPVDGATCHPTPSSKPTPSPAVSRETPGPAVTVIITPGSPLEPAPTESVVVVPAPRSTSSPRPRSSPTASPRPSATPTCTPLPFTSVCRPVLPGR